MQRDCSEETAREIDEEVKAILNEAYTRTKEVLAAHRDQLEKIAAELLKKESPQRPGVLHARRQGNAALQRTRATAPRGSGDEGLKLGRRRGQLRENRAAMRPVQAAAVVSLELRFQFRANAKEDSISAIYFAFALCGREGITLGESFWCQ